MAAKINTKTMLNYEELTALDEDVIINDKGAAYTEAGIELLKNTTGIYSSAEFDPLDPVDFNDMIDPATTRIHGNDLILGLDNGLTVTVQNYFKKNGKSNFKTVVGNDGVATDLVEEGFIVNGNKFNTFNLAENHDMVDGRIIASTITGTAFNDTVDIHGFSADQMVDAKGTELKNITINTGAGNDTITASVIDDVITGGTGENQINYTTGAGAYYIGDDTIKLTKNEILNLNVNSDAVKLAKDGDNIVATAYAELQVSYQKSSLEYDQVGTELAVDGGYHKETVTSSAGTAYDLKVTTGAGPAVTNVEIYDAATENYIAITDETLKAALIDACEPLGEVGINYQTLVGVTEGAVTNYTRVITGAEAPETHWAGSVYLVDTLDVTSVQAGDVTLATTWHVATPGDHAYEISADPVVQPVRYWATVGGQNVDLSITTIEATTWHLVTATSGLWNGAAYEDEVTYSALKQVPAQNSFTYLRMGKNGDIATLALDVKEGTSAAADTFEKDDNGLYVSEVFNAETALGTFTLDKYVKNTTGAAVFLDNGASTVWDQEIYIDGTNGGKIDGTLGNDVITLGDKDASLTETAGLDEVTHVGGEKTKLAYTMNSDVVQNFVREGYAIGGNANSFSYDAAVNGCAFTGTELTITDASKAKYDVSFANGNADLSEGKGNNILYVDATVDPLHPEQTPGVTVKTGAGNDVVFLASQPGLLGAKNSISYTGGKDAYRGSLGDEAYTVSAMDKNTSLVINDWGGNDSLTFTPSGDVAPANLKNMTIFFDMNDEGQTTIYDGLMFINDSVLSDSKALSTLFNGTGKGFVEIDNFFDAGNAIVVDHAMSGDAKGDGYIENFKFAGENDFHAIDNKVAAIAENVAAWLDSNQNYDSAMDVINAGNTADIQSLMLCYQTGTVA